MRKKAENEQQRKRILLGQLNSFGDCLYATTVAHQIKNDYPGCHLTWAIGSMCRPILAGNPDVDEVWEIPLHNIGEVATVWPRFEREARKRKRRGEFDEIFLTQLAPGNLQNYDGTIRTSIFRGYPRPITVPVAPILRLSPEEIDDVRLFAVKHHLDKKQYVVLFECSPKSGQSCITRDLAIDVAQKYLIMNPNGCFVLSSSEPFRTMDDRIIDGSILSLRENAELTKYCTLLIGGSSGISWIATSDWATPLPMIQLIKADAIWFASMVRDHEYCGLPTGNIIEMKDCNSDRIAQCVNMIQTRGFDSARTLFHEHIPISFDSYRVIQKTLLRKYHYIRATRLLLNNLRRYGWRWDLLQWCLPSFIRRIVKFIVSFVVTVHDRLRLVSKKNQIVA